ncbi:flavin-containing monooxygenase 5-like isoform X2 [Ostrea edulis]|nr:flavin-containing monooxygenase 5-like isoform X2 [Ostrea edulis]XP_048730178.2 flavin-containing monooxygenase 5-like isoform X2 [Ostrea edulis]XP_055998311.1 flavin-containing monooxygenase 5-like isoform X2 [Ostrea edulis]
MTKTVAVVGAGASGLPAVKCCVDEGLQPLCFERTDHIGGLWHFTDEPIEGQSCVMKSTSINCSKEMTCYSDYPIPKEFPIFMHNKDILKYFNMYADNFNLKKYIRFRTQVISVKRRSDFKTSGQWNITTKDLTTGDTKELVFDAVMLCTGHHADKNIPDFPGLKEFQGTVVHTHDFRHPARYEDKRVVVIGIGNSGGDVSVELSRIASQVFLSTRRGAWVFNRIGDFGCPIDMLILRRSLRFLTSMMSIFRDENEIIAKKLNERFDHAKYSLQPKHSPLAQHPTANDELPNRIISGSVKVKPNVRKFTKTGVEFEDGTFEDGIDVVILATGYKFGFPFLDKSVIEVVNNRIELYKNMFPPDLEKNTLACIGFIQVLGSIFTVSEQQARLFARVVKGDVVLPGKEEMWKDVGKKLNALRKRFVESPRHTIQVDFIDFMDELSKLNGNYPHLGKLMLTDPRLAAAIFFGPATPYQYRIMGPGKWAGAREAIFTQWERNDYPLATRPLGFDTETNQNSRLWKMCFLLILMVALIISYFRE